MRRPDDQLPTGTKPAFEAEGVETKPAARVTGASGGSRPRAWILQAWVLAAALLSGAATWAWGEYMLDYYQPSEAAAKNLFNPGPLRKELAVIVPRNVAIAFGAQGALLGLLLGLAGGLTRGAVKAGVATALVGAVAGGLAGAGLSMLLVPLHQAYYDPAGQTLLVTALVRGGVWAAIGAVTASAFGWGLGERRQVGRALILGVLGGLVATLAFETVNAFAFPNDQNDQVLPTTHVSRLLAYLSVAVIVGISAVLAAGPPPATATGGAGDGGRSPVVAG